MPGLRNALTAGLDAGLTLNELKEVLVQMYAYCGFPRSLNALNELMVLAKDRASRGINDTVGAEAGAPPPERASTSARPTRRSFAALPVKGDLFLFAPAIDEFRRRICSGTFSAATIWTGRPGSSPPSRPWPP